MSKAKKESHEPGSSVSIRPGVSVLSLFKHLNYDPWYAVGEFVDNSIQSYLDNKGRLEKLHGQDFQLKIEIEIAPGGEQIVVRDNAGGISAEEYTRAFKPAEPPEDTSGLAEFGVGMKSAACWFSSDWSVRTSALGESVERELEMDVDQIVEKEVEELNPTEREVDLDDHFTVITLNDLHRPLRGRTIGKIKDHLTSLYRKFLREGDVVITYDGDPLQYNEPEVLVAPYFKTDEEGDEIEWRKELDFTLENGIRVHGFAAIRETGSTSGAGLSLFRRKRLIIGSRDDSYRPEEIFGKSNSFVYQRLFGEFTLEGAEVTHTKDGFKWGGYEDEFITRLKEELNDPPLPLIRQAKGYRKTPSREDLVSNAESALEETTEVIEREASTVLEEHKDEGPDEDPLPGELPEVDKTAASRTIEIDFKGVTWRISVELSDDPHVSEWLSISERPDRVDDDGDRIRELGVRLSLDHPFMTRFASMSSDQLEPVVRIAMALALAEILARESGVKMAGTHRHYVNSLLEKALHKP